MLNIDENIFLLSRVYRLYIIQVNESTHFVYNVYL